MSPLGSIWTTGAGRIQYIQFVITKRVGCVRGLRDALYVGIANYNSTVIILGFHEPLPPFQAPGPHLCKKQGRLAEVLALTFRHSELEVTYKYGMSATAHLIAFFSFFSVHIETDQQVSVPKNPALPQTCHCAHRTIDQRVLA